MYVTIADLKRHLNIDHSEDDVLLTEYEEVAEDVIASYLNRPLTDFVTETTTGGTTTTVLKPSIRHAIRLLVGDYYANREDATVVQHHSLSTGLTALLLPLKKFE